MFISGGVFLSLFTFFSLQAYAVSPESLSKSEQKRTAPAFNPRLGTFFYTIRWEGSRVARAAVSILRQKQYYRIVVHSKTTGMIDNLHRIKYTGEGTVNQSDFSAVKSVYTEKIGSNEKKTSVYYHDSGEIEATQFEKRKNKDPKTQVRKFFPEGELFDVFSAMILARSFSWRVGLSEQFEVFTGKKTYIVTLNCIRKDVYEEGGHKIDAWVIAPVVIDPSKKGKKPQRKKTRIYLSADGSKDILKIKTKTAIGTVKLKLKEFKPQ